MQEFIITGISLLCAGGFLLGYYLITTYRWKKREAIKLVRFLQSCHPEKSRREIIQMIIDA